MSEHHTITRRKLLQSDDGAAAFAPGIISRSPGAHYRNSTMARCSSHRGRSRSNPKRTIQLLLNLSEDRRDETCDTGPTKEGYIACSKAERRNCARLDSCSDHAALTLKAFVDIQDEPDTTYLRVLST